jgi:sugar lactone lactonase YvrE
MKNILQSITSVCILLAISTSTIFAIDLNQPESIIYDSVSNTFFISNFGSNSIFRRDTDGNLSVFYTEGITRPCGLFILGDTLFVANTTSISCLSISADTLITSIPIAGSRGINDITSDYKGKLYFTDSDMGYIYDLDLTTGVSGIIISNLNFPNGIMYDYISKRIIYVSTTTNYIYELNLDDSTSTPLIATAGTTCDGLGQDNCGNIYISSWDASAVYVYDNNFELVPTSISTSLSGPADISVDMVHNRLLIPEMSGNVIKLVELFNECTTIVQTSPINGATELDTVVNLTWEAIEGAVSYQIQYSLRSKFNSINKVVNSTTNMGTLHNLLSDTTYYWRVRTNQGPGKSIFGQVFSFRTRDIATSVSEAVLKDYKVFLNGDVLKTVGLKEGSAYKISVYSIMGTQILCVDYSKDKDINLSELKPGVYIVVLRGNANQILSCNKIIY